MGDHLCPDARFLHRFHFYYDYYCIMDETHMNHTNLVVIHTKQLLSIKYSWIVALPYLSISCYNLTYTLFNTNWEVPTLHKQDINSNCNDIQEYRSYLFTIWWYDMSNPHNCYLQDYNQFCSSYSIKHLNGYKNKNSNPIRRCESFS